MSELEKMIHCYVFNNASKFARVTIRVINTKKCVLLNIIDKVVSKLFDLIGLLYRIKIKFKK